ncbi:MAG TPA: DUF1571 domain-containing protein [Williamwhitmania sp.]|nr:DUF1571 domain-containing protein [Williamwhitmania sp.]
MLSCLRNAVVGIAMIALNQNAWAAPQKNDQLKIFWSTLNKLEMENTISFQLRFSEVEPSGERNSKTGFFKLRKHPFDFYYRQDSPQKGLELLYVEGVNNNKVLIHRNSFPWISFSLDPLGNIMLRESRHPIFEAGYWYLVEVVKHITTVNKQASVTYEGEELCLEKQCFRFLVDNPSYRLEHYRTKKGETLYSIAKSQHLFLYTLRMLNPNVDPSCIPDLTMLTIPSDYARKMYVFIDKKELIPIKIEIYSDHGLLEEMEFTNVTQEVMLSPYDFSRDNTTYSF